MAEYSKNTQEFVGWVKEHFNFVSDKFEVQDLRANGQGRGLIAKEDISKGEILFDIPRDSILNVDTAAISLLNNNNNKSVLNSLNQWQSLIICVSYEWFIGDESKFKDYFKVLPLSTGDFESLMFWNDEELQYLKPSGVLSRIGRNEAEEMYAILVGDIIPNKLKLQELADFLTLERFHIVASLIMSYSFDVDHPSEVDALENDGEEEEQSGEEQAGEEQAGEEQAGEEQEGEESDDEINSEPISQDTYFKSMVPLADTLNANTTLFNARLTYEESKLVMTAEKDILKGEQIYNFYGELPNSEILRKYGYIELPSSKFEFGEISLNLVMEFFEDKFSKLFKFLKSDKLIEIIFETIQDSEYLLNTITEDMESGIVIEKYEIYENGEILPELLLLILIITSIFNSAKTDEKWFKKITKNIERRVTSDLLSFINRTILKCHQLIENKSILTNDTVNNLNEIIKLRISEYPVHIIDNSYKLPENYEIFNKRQLSDIVLFDEVKCFKDVIDGKFPTIEDDGSKRFSVIEDDKFLKNLMKRKNEEDDKKLSKKNKRS